MSNSSWLVTAYKRMLRAAARNSGSGRSGGLAAWRRSTAEPGQGLPPSRTPACRSPPRGSRRRRPSPTTTAASPTAAAPLTFTATFSGPINGVSAAGVTAANGTVSDARRVTAATYEFDVTPAAAGTGVTGPTHADPITFTVNFSEDVTGFSVAGVTASNVTVVGLTVNGAWNASGREAVPAADGTMYPEFTAAVPGAGESTAP